MRELMLVVAVAGCAEPVVELSFELPANADSYDTSCVTAVEVRAIGAGGEDDYLRSCIELESAAPTYSALRDAIRGTVVLDIPDSGLRGISVRGWAGPSACKQTDELDPDYREDVTSNLAFHAKAFAGQDEIALRAVPNLDCSTTNLEVRVVDMLGLVTAGSTAACSTAMAYPDRAGWSGIGTMLPKPFGKGIDYFGTVSWAEGTNNLVRFEGMTELVHDGSCLALAGANETGAGTSCVVGANVCAAAGELETVAVDYDLWNQVDRTLQGRFPGITFGSVWSNTNPRTPLAGARVTVDPSHGEVVYIDPPDASGAIRVRPDRSAGTGPSGLFILYADTIAETTIEAGGRTRIVMLGTPHYTIGGAMIPMP